MLLENTVEMGVLTFSLQVAALSCVLLIMLFIGCVSIELFKNTVLNQSACVFVYFLVQFGINLHE